MSLGAPFGDGHDLDLGCCLDLPRLISVSPVQSGAHSSSRSVRSSRPQRSSTHAAVR